jgi:hypothetical protein
MNLHQNVRIVCAHVVCCMMCSQLTLAEAPKPETWSVNAVVAAVAWREATLINYSLRFSERTFIAKTTEPLKESYRNEVELHRREGTITLVTSSHALTWSRPQIERSRESWDGRVARGIYTVIPEGRPERVGATVCEQIPPVLKRSSCLDALNLSCETPLSVKLKQMIEEYESTATVSVSEEQGETLVTLALLNPRKGPPNQWELVFVPGKDFVTKRIRFQCYSSRDFKIPTAVGAIELSDLRQIDGIWMPMTVIDDRKFFTGGRPDGYNRFESRVDSFTIARPSDEIMAVDIPPGVLVTDTVSREVYILKPDGSKQQQSFYDVETGEMIHPKAP